MDRPRVLIFIRGGRVTQVEVNTELEPLVTVLYDHSEVTAVNVGLVTDLGGESWWQADLG